MESKNILPTNTITDEQRLKYLFEECGYSVNLYEQDGETYAELEDYTSGGVDMIINLTPFCLEQFKGYVENFDVDEEIDLHRQDKRYCKAFTISRSVHDFEEWEKRIEKDYITIHDKFYYNETPKQYKNPAGQEETIEVTLTEDKYPNAYRHKLQELMENGMTEEEARKAIAESSITLELYYHENYGLMALESEAVESLDEIHSPYNGKVFVIENDEDE